LNWFAFIIQQIISSTNTVDFSKLKLYFFVLKVPDDMLPNPVWILDEENNLCLEDQVAFDQSEKKNSFHFLNKLKPQKDAPFAN